MSALRTPRLTASGGQVSLPTGNALSAPAGGFLAPGRVIQVRHARTPATRYTIAAQDLQAIPGLEIHFTPLRSNSLIRLTAMVNGMANYVETVGFLRNGSPIVNNTNVNSNGSILTTYDGGPIDADYIHGRYIEFYDSVNGAPSITYSVGVSSSWNGTVYTTYINDRVSNDMRSISSMTIWEIAQ